MTEEVEGKTLRISLITESDTITNILIPLDKKLTLHFDIKRDNIPVNLKDISLRINTETIKFENSRKREYLKFQVHNYKRSGADQD